MELVVFIIFAFFMSVSFLIMVTLRKKKSEFKDEMTIKSYISTICFFLLGAIGFIAHALNALSAPIWWIIVILLMIGAYFTKYLPKPEGMEEK